MIRHKITQKTSLNVNDSYEGETIITKMNRIVNNKEPIKDGAPIIHTERKYGVLPEYNIRTDRFEVAREAMDAVHKTELAKRWERIKNNDNMKVVGGKNEQKDSGEPTSVEGTSK